MLDLEQLLADLRGLENELNAMGVEAVLDERDDGMPEFDFEDFGGGLVYDGKGFRFTIWAGILDDLYTTDLFREFRHELFCRLASQFDRKVRFTRDGWRELSGGDTPMPENLERKADEYKRTAERLRDAIRDDGVPVFLDPAEFKTLRRHDPRELLTGPDGDRLRGLRLVERRYYVDQVFDELTDKGRAAVEYTARTMGRSLR